MVNISSGDVRDLITHLHDSAVVLKKASEELTNKSDREDAEALAEMAASWHKTLKTLHTLSTRRIAE